MGKIILYYGNGGSAPSRAVLLTLKALNLPFEYRVLNLLAREHQTPEYLAINPHGTIPTLIDDDVTLIDSHAIITFLVDKYGTDDSLYPKDLIKRAKINQLLFYEATIVFERTFFPISKQIFSNNNVIPHTKIDAIDQVYERLETFLEEYPYLAGNHVTVADFSLVTTVSTLFNFAELDAVKYRRLAGWVKRLEELSYYAEGNGAGLKQYCSAIKRIGFKVLR